MMRRITLYSLLPTLYFILISCSQSTPNQHIILATTTSVQDSGLLDILIPAFEKESNVHIKPIAVGSGEAMAMGRRGDADVLLTHSPDDEDTFMQEGFGRERRLVMYNYFLVVGPDATTASETAADAFSAIAAAGLPFISRDDKSGTHKKELSLWKLAGIKPPDHLQTCPVGEWYIKSGSGMGDALMIASEKKAYTLTDRATYLALKSKLNLTVICREDASLKNEYSVIVVKTGRPQGEEMSRMFAGFLTSIRTQEIINKFGVDKFGEPLFFTTKAEPTASRKAQR